MHRHIEWVRWYRKSRRSVINGRKTSVVVHFSQAHYAWVLSRIDGWENWRSGRRYFCWFDEEARAPLGKCEHMDTRRCLYDPTRYSVSSVRSGQWAIQHEQRAQWVTFLRQPIFAYLFFSGAPYIYNLLKFSLYYIPLCFTKVEVEKNFCFFFRCVYYFLSFI